MHERIVSDELARKKPRRERASRRRSSGLPLHRPNARERLRAVLREHGNEHINDVSELGLVGGGNIDEDVLGLDRDLGAVRVDLWCRERW